MSRFADADQAVTEEANRVRCIVCSGLAQLEPDELADIRDLFADHGKASAHIARVLSREGIKCGESAVRKHRAKHEPLR